MNETCRTSDRRGPGWAVAHLADLLYGAFPIRRRSGVRGCGRLKAGDAADSKSARRPHPSYAVGAGACGLALALVGLLLCSCGQSPTGAPVAAPDPHLATLGTLEVTAKLVEIPDGAIFKRDLYDYATILKYQVVQVHRGAVHGDTLYVGHYNPWKPRAEAADQRVQGLGGTLKRFRAGDTHRMALEAPIDDHFMGGLVNKYFGQTTNVLHWAIWTNPEER